MHFGSKIRCQQIKERYISPEVRSHEKRRCSKLGPTQSRISPSILKYMNIHLPDAALLRWLLEKWQHDRPPLDGAARRTAELPPPVVAHRTHHLQHRKKFCCHRKEFRCHRKKFYCHRKDFRCRRKKFRCHRKKFHCHRKDFRCHRKKSRCRRKKFRCQRNEFRCRPPHAPAA